MFLLETNVISELRKARAGKADPNVETWVRTVSPASCSPSAAMRPREQYSVRGSMSALIAATALTHGMTVVTRNLADIESTGAQLLNPWAR
jgi:predicted nucleic acid-binding protein